MSLDLNLIVYFYIVEITLNDLLVSVKESKYLYKFPHVNMFFEITRSSLISSCAGLQLNPKYSQYLNYSNAYLGMMQYMHYGTSLALNVF